jgi:branched-chain amino acid transport system permease protein
MTPSGKRALIMLAGVGLIGLPFVVTNDYQLRLATFIAINALAAIGLNLVKGFAGQISVGQHGLCAVGGYASAMLSVTLAWPVWLSIPAAVLIAVMAGLVIGLPSLRIQGAYLAIATLAFAESLRIVLNASDWAGASLGISHVPPLGIGGYVFDTPRAFYYAVMAITWFGVWISYNIVRSSLGRALLAIRDDPLVASVAGIELRRYKLIAFSLSAVYGGLAGALQGHVNGFVHPENYTLSLMVMLMLMIVVGGLGSIGGSIIGAIIVTTLFDLTRGYVEIQMILFASILILSVLFLPGGVVTLFRGETRWIRRLRTRTELES